MLFDGRDLMLAPMAGITDTVFRALCLELGANHTYTEMVSAKGLSYANEKTKHLLDVAESETAVSVQIFGHEPNTMAEQARWIASHLQECLLTININMGCPARKITSKGDGSALMRDVSLARAIIEQVVRAVSVPVTVKFRRGFEEGRDTSLSFAQMAEAAGVAAVIVHGRYALQFYRGQADWDCIAAIKDALDIPVVGNGDVTSGMRALALRRHTNCDAIMVARAAQGNPWVFADIQSVLTTGQSAQPPSVRERMELAKRHARLMSEKEGPVIVKMRRQAMDYVHGLPQAASLRQDITHASTYEDFAAIFERACAYPQAS